MLELLANPDTWIAFLTLTALELVLGMDNIVFLSILVDRLPPDRRAKARSLGLFLAMFMRIGLLALLAWIVGMTTPLFFAIGRGFSGRDLVLLGGGVFLLWKSTREIHHMMEDAGAPIATRAGASFASVIVQIVLIDLVFSLDSIVTAVGMVDSVIVMAAAVIASALLMMVFAGAIGRVVSAHPTIKMLALAFLVVIGVVLIADGCGRHVPKGYVYFAMAFAVAVEALNLRLRARSARRVEAHEQTPGPSD